MRILVIAGTTSGVGKTTIATGLMGALVRRGLKVQPFKAGPDYIDPSYHTWITGVPSRNLDTWLLSPETLKELFFRAMARKDIAVIEGVMGLYDGRSALSEEGSTAELAKLLGAPVVLVVDAAKAARSLAALVSGYRSFDPALRLGGVILNNIGGEAHLQLCQQAIEGSTGTPVLGFLPRRDDLQLPERHLGLIPTVEGSAGEAFKEHLMAQIEASLDLERLLALSEVPIPPTPPPLLFPLERKPAQARIAVARDKAFSFYYQDSLDFLEAWGGELVPFSPLTEATLPSDIGGLYLGGGFPELYAAELAANESLRRAVKAATEAGLPIYAECGGLMYLGSSLKDFQGREYPMVGAIPLSSRIDAPRLSLGYRTVRALGDGPLLRRGETVRGHEFHWSILDGQAASLNAYQVLELSGRREGFHQGKLLASYIHLHLGSYPAMARRFVEACGQYRKGNKR